MPRSEQIGKCHNCKEEISFLIPEYSVVNTPRFSLVVFPHEKSQICPKCGATHQFYVKAVQGVVGLFIPFEEPVESKIIIPGG